MLDLIAIVFAKYLYIAVIVLAIIYALFQPRQLQKKMLILAVIGLPLILLVAKISGHFFYDPRPFVSQHIKPLIPHAADNGFPSDHTLISAAFASVLFVFNKKWGSIAGIFAVLVGAARVYARIHSPIDIIGSMIISAVVVYAVVFALKKFTRLLV